MPAAGLLLTREPRRERATLIVAAALEAGCTRLLSEDLRDGQRIERLTIEDPFAER